MKGFRKAVAAKCTVILALNRLNYQQILREVLARDARTFLFRIKPLISTDIQLLEERENN